MFYLVVRDQFSAFTGQQVFLEASLTCKKAENYYQARAFRGSELASGFEVFFKGGQRHHQREWLAG